MIDALHPAVMVHRDTGFRVTLATDAALARWFDNRSPFEWVRVA